MRQVMAYPSAAFHKLNLFFVYFYYSTVRVGRSVNTNDEAVAQRGNLKIVAYS